MNRNYRRYNRNQPNNQVYRSNFLPPTPPVNNTPQNEHSETGNNNGYNNRHPTPPDNKKTWQYADTIAIGALAIAIIMAIVTYRLFELSDRQAQSVIDAGNAVKESTIIAKATLKETNSFNTKTLDGQVRAGKKADSIDDVKSINDKLVFEYQKKSLNAQIAALTEIQKQFAKTNESFLEAGVFSMKHFGKDKVIVSCSIKNLSEQTSNIIEGYASIFQFKTDTNVNEIKSYMEFLTSIQPIKSIYNKKYVTKETPLQIVVEIAQDSFDSGHYQDVIDGKWSIYLYGFFYYNNLVTDKKRIYKFCVRLTHDNAVNNYYMIYNDNDDIKSAVKKK